MGIFLDEQIAARAFPSPDPGIPSPSFVSLGDESRSIGLKCTAFDGPRYDGRLKRRATILVNAALLILVAGCGEPAPKSDAELGLNAQQSNGRLVFERYCAACHYAYSSSGSKGPSMKHLFKKQFLPSGLPATDRFVGQTIVSGRGMMPPTGGAITDQQLEDLLAYLHTL